MPRTYFFMIMINIVLIAQTTACHKINNDFERIELECGASPNHRPEDYNYLKLFTENGPIIGSVPESNIKAQLVDLQENSSVLVVDISPKGCAILPKDRLVNSRLEVRIQNSSLAAVAVFTSPPENDLGSLTLKPSLSGKYSLACPRNGIFASEGFPNPIQVNDPGSIETHRIILVAQPMDPNFPAVPLFRKDFGYALDSASIPSEISTKNLTEGIYYLRAISANLTEDFGLLPRFINDEKTCSLTVMKTAPVIKSDLFSTRGFFVNKLNQALPIAPAPEIAAITYEHTPDFLPERN